MVLDMVKTSSRSDASLSQSESQVYKFKNTDELIVLAQQQDLKAMEQLVQRVQNNVFMTLRQLAPERSHEDILDLTQDVLLKMCRSLKTLREPKTFKYWLNRIITHRYYDELRKKGRQPNVVSLDEPFENDDDFEVNQTSRSIADSSTLPDQSILQQELDIKLQEAIVNLPEQFRTIIVLRELQGMTYDEIASITDLNIGTVKSRLARARLKLQEAIAPYLKGSQ